MRAIRHCGGILSLIVVCVALVASPAVRADELLVMPYSCRVVGGEPVLIPSEDRGHPVIGRREQREFRACSPVNPRLCRRWTVHRFDLDCDGRRVPWVDVAAAADATREGRAFVSDDGRFALEMPARWSLPPDAPCARHADEDRPRFGAFRRFCAERLARVRRVTIAMPPGFAPMRGIDGIFVEDSAPRGAVADATPPRHDPTPETRVEDWRREQPEAESVPLPVKKRMPQKEVAALPSPPARAEVPAPKADAPSKAAPSPDPVKREPSASDTAAAGAAPVVPKIINSANAPEPAARAPSRVDETGALPERSFAPPVDEGVRADAEVAGSGESAPDRLAAADHEDAAPMLPVGAAGASLRVDATVVTVGCLLLLTLLTLAVVLRRGRTPAAPALARDIAAVSLGKSGTPDGPRVGAGALTIVPEPLTGRDLAAPPTLSPGPPALLGDAMPRTREEALEVLGMGIAPDVNEAAIKKIIDGLRLSWHPDHARDPEDRALRELRLKQINAAWDIIAGTRAS